MDNTTDKLLFYGTDLTHNYIALASGTFPLGLAYVASAVRTKFASEIEIKLFKYPEDLNEALAKETPTFYFFSNYVWNQNLNMRFAQLVKERSPETLVVSGGPNLTRNPKGREDFLRANPFIDFWIVEEGEIASCFLIKAFLGLNGDISRLKEESIPSALTITEDGDYKSGPLAPRMGMNKFALDINSPLVPTDFFDDLQSLNDIPSPYTNGLMNKFFDNALYPLIETNRGCPFSCSFCQQGTPYFTKMAVRSLENCVEEFEFIASMMSKYSPGISRVEIADPNFAMFNQDLQFCEQVRKIQEKYGWPLIVGCSTGKNQPDKILNAVSKLMPDSLVVSNSIQSANPATLEAIKRSNVSMDGYKQVQMEIQRRGLRSMADVILGLPLETLESHFKAVMSLIDAGVQEFTSYQAMILKSTDLELEAEQDKYGMKTKWRLLPRAIGQYHIMGEDRTIPEVEQIVIKTDTLTFEDYLSARKLHLTTIIYHNSGVFKLIHKYLSAEGVPISEFIMRVYKKLADCDSPLLPVYEGFIKETKNELFDTEEECLQFYSDPIIAPV